MSQPMTCERCGATLPARAADAPTPCTYCGAVAAPPVRLVERVIERVVERVVVAQPSAEVDADAGPPCPRCARAMRRGTSRSTTLLGCSRCYGIWLARGDVERLLRDRDTDIVPDARRFIAGALAPRQETRTQLGCIVCGQAMRRVEIPTSVLALDVCDAHGVWFDWNDLPAFVNACQSWRAGSTDDLEVAGLPKHKRPQYDEEPPDPGWVARVLRPVS